VRGRVGEIVAEAAKGDRQKLDAMEEVVGHFVRSGC
jgi:hypothetical protein